ncbi:MAG: broad specificity phosphatase PhoE [Candidatus Paceibacteria bacterium]|jgi:broad specificity phosphatase PhoE
MEIFLVRHGQTGGNVARRHQTEHTELSFVGEQQVREVAEQIKQYEPTHLVTSSLVRAVETARVIGQECGLVPETNSRFIELVKPNFLFGHYHWSIKSLWFYMQWYMGKDTDSSTGGESYNDLLKRFESTKEYLTQYPSDARIVVVSHTFFINLFVAHLCRDKTLGPLSAMLAFKKLLTMPNTDVIKICFSSEVDDGICAWSVDNHLETSSDSGNIVPPV